MVFHYGRTRTHENSFLIRTTLAKSLRLTCGWSPVIARENFQVFHLFAATGRSRSATPITRNHNACFVSQPV